MYKLVYPRYLPYFQEPSTAERNQETAGSNAQSLKLCVGSLTIPAFLVILIRRSLRNLRLSNVENFYGTLEDGEIISIMALEGEGKVVRTLQVATSSSITTWRFFNVPSA